jgi:hypothetical protein
LDKESSIAWRLPLLGYSNNSTGFLPAEQTMHYITITPSAGSPIFYAFLFSRPREMYLSGKPVMVKVLGDGWLGARVKGEERG